MVKVLLTEINTFNDQSLLIIFIFFSCNGKFPTQFISCMVFHSSMNRLKNGGKKTADKHQPDKRLAGKRPSVEKS